MMSIKSIVIHQNVSSFGCLETKAVDLLQTTKEKHYKNEIVTATETRHILFVWHKCTCHSH